VPPSFIEPPLPLVPLVPLLPPFPLEPLEPLLPPLPVPLEPPLALLPELPPELFEPEAPLEPPLATLPALPALPPAPAGESSSEPLQLAVESSVSTAPKPKIDVRNKTIARTSARKFIRERPREPAAASLYKSDFPHLCAHTNTAPPARAPQSFA